MAATTTAFEAELLAGGFGLTARGLMAGPAYQLRQQYLDGVADPLAHTRAKNNPREVKALTDNGKLASFDAITSAGGDGGGTDPLDAPVFPVVSRGLVAHPGPTVSGFDTAFINDGDYATTWRSEAFPVDQANGIQVVFDISGLSAAQKADVWVVLRNQSRGSWNRPPGALGINGVGAFKARNYTIDVHAAAAGGSGPLITDAGWVNRVTIVDNRWSDRIHKAISLAGMNWIRVRVTEATGPAGNHDFGVQEIEIRPTLGGTQDSWLMIGDSVGQEGYGPRNTDGGFWPNYADGGASGPIDRMLRLAREPGPVLITDVEGGFGLSATTPSYYSERATHLDFDLHPTHFVVFQVLTNDANGWNAPQVITDPAPQLLKTRAQEMITTLAGQGRVAVFPTTHAAHNAAFTDQNVQVGQTIYAQLIAANANAIAGPDFYTFFKAHPQLLRSDNLHPTYDPAQGAYDAGDGHGPLTGYQHILRMWGVWFAQFYAA